LGGGLSRLGSSEGAKRRYFADVNFRGLDQNPQNSRKFLSEVCMFKVIFASCCPKYASGQTQKAGAWLGDGKILAVSSSRHLRSIEIVQKKIKFNRFLPRKGIQHFFERGGMRALTPNRLVKKIGGP